MRSDKKVLFIIENATVPLDVRVWQEAITLRDRGWLVTIICPAAKGSSPDAESKTNLFVSETVDGIKVYRFPLAYAERGILDYFVEFASAFIFIGRLSWHVWRQEHVDIIHIGNPPDIFFPIALFYRLLGARIIFDHHDLFPEYVSYRYHGIHGRIFYILARAMEYLTLHSAHSVISTNESYQQIAIQRGKISPNRVTVVRNGPLCDQFTPVDPVPELKQDFTYSASYAGVMGYGDGVLELVSSIHYIVKELGRRDILFFLIGNGAEYHQVVDKVAAFKLNDFVVMTGMIYDRLLLRQYLCTADVLLSPEPLTQLNKYSTFIKIAEYMAMGKPIVAYDLQETRYTAHESALYVEPGNNKAYGKAIITLIDDAPLRDKMGSMARNRLLEELCWQQQQRNLLEAYRQAYYGNPMPPMNTDHNH
jgi:glycosyltransferase involved in cell wall biosynthesis